MDNIKIYHKDWIDTLYLLENNRLKRDNGNKDEGVYEIKDNFLKIIWDEWGVEYFYKKDNLINYFLITSEYIFELYEYLIEINIIINKKLNKYLLDTSNKRAYFKKDLKCIGNYNINKKILVINDEKYLFIDHKYYYYRDIESIYSYIEINDIQYLLSNIYLTAYKDFDLSNCEYYIKYKNKLSINNKNYESIDNNLIYTDYIKKNCNTSILKEDDFQKNNNEIYLKDINLKLIEFYKNFNIKIIVFSDIINEEKEYIYDDINIVYYNNINILENVIKNNDIKIINSINDDTIITEEYIQNRWKEINNINNVINNENLIPKILHFIWIGKNDIPEIYLEYIESWINKHPDYEYCFWNDKNIPNLINQKFYDEADTYAMKADILRYELLYFYGGIYIDCDFLCLKNIDELIINYDGFSGFESNEYIAIGLMGFKQYDEFLYKIIKNISFNIMVNDKGKIPEQSGPIFFTNMYEKYIKNKENISNKYKFFEKKYFYSYSFEDKLENKKYIINDDNYAIHMWGY